MRKWLKKFLCISFFIFIILFIFNEFGISIKSNLKIIFPLILLTFYFLIKELKNIQIKTTKNYKKIFYATILLVLLNFVFYSLNIHTNYFLSKKILLLLNSLILFLLTFLNINTRNIRVSKNTKNSFIFILLLTIIAGYIRFKNLGDFDIYHDEVYYASSVKSYIYDSSSNLWDYISDKPSKTLYKQFITNTVGNFVKIFGYSEFNLRFLFALIGTLTIPLTFFLSYLLFENKYISFLSSIFLTFSDIHIYLSRFIRQYSFFIFSIELVAILIIIGLKNIKKINIKNIIYLLLPFLIIVFNFVNISVFSVIYIFIYLFFLYFIYRRINFEDKNKKTAIILFLIIFLLYVDYFTDIKIFDIKHILENNIKIKLSVDIAGDYLKWLFIDLKTNSNYLGLILTILSSIKLIKEKNKEKSLILLSFFYIPLTLIIINQKHPHDFRYISFILPFFYIILSYFLISISKKKELFIIIFSVLFLIKPSFPDLLIKPFLIKAQADWTEDDGKRINSRTVAPSYKNSYSYLIDNSEILDKSDTKLFIIDGVQYLPIYSNVKYFLLKSYLGKPVEYKTNKEIDYDELFNSKLIIVGAYMHWIQEDYLEKIRKECKQVNSDSFYFKYNLSYENLDSKYPSIFLCNFN